MSAIERFSCDDVLQRLEDYLDRELTPHEMELARQHLAVCSECAEEMDFSAHTLETIKTKAREIDVAPEFIERLSVLLEKTQKDGA